jgi:DNA repair photolyase
VANPCNPGQVARVSLHPEEVEAVVFWTKNPAPLLPVLDELERRGLARTLFLYTLNDYPEALEPGVPALRERIETFLKLSDRVGPARVIWRYDPIVLSNRTDPEFHQARFAGLCRTLAGATERVVVSVVDSYRAADRRLASLSDQGFTFQNRPERRPATLKLLTQLAQTARENRIQIQSCAETPDFARAGVPPGACIDAALIERLWPLGTAFKKDSGQRQACRCAQSKDIGATDTCIQGCAYCYATFDPEKARRRHERHDPRAAELAPLAEENRRPLRSDLLKNPPRRRGAAHQSRRS